MTTTILIAPSRQKAERKEKDDRTIVGKTVDRRRLCGWGPNKKVGLVLRSLIPTNEDLDNSNSKLKKCSPECKMCLKSPGTDVGAAGFERCPKTYETHFISGSRS